MGQLRSVILCCLLVPVSTGATFPQQPASIEDPLQVKGQLEEINHQVRESFHRLTRRAYLSYLGLQPADLLNDQEVLGNADTLFSDLNTLLQHEIEPPVGQGRRLSALYFQRTGDRSYLDQFEFYHHRIRGLILSNAEDFLGAREALLEAAKRAPKLSDPGEMAYVLNNLSYCNFQIGEVEEATADLQRAVRIAEESGDESALGLFLYNLGWVYMNSQRAEAAVSCFKRSAQVSQSLNLPIRELAALNNLGSIHLSRREWEEAKACFVRSLEISRELNSLRFRAMSAFNFAVILAREEQHREAARLLDEALSIYEDDGSTAFMDSEKKILQQKALLLLQFVNTQARQQIVSPYLEREIDPQEAISEGHIHSHFSHLFQTRQRSNSEKKRETE